MRTLVATLLALLALAAPAVARTEPPRIGISDQKASMFTDPRYLALGLDMARLVVPWDALHVRWAREQVDVWLAAARTAGVEPLVIFSQSRHRRRTQVLPSRRLFVREFRHFRRRYPWVTEFATWNEANHGGQPTHQRPGRVARYWKALRRQCRRCTILGASVLDARNMVEWVRRFQRAAGVRPRYWGLNNYRDVNYGWTRNTRALLRVTRGEVWLTETGGIVKRRTRSRIRFREGRRHAARGLRWLMRRIVPLSPRITRVYLYHWSSSTRRDTWDSAFIGPRDAERPALRVLRHHLAASR